MLNDCVKCVAVYWNVLPKLDIVMTCKGAGYLVTSYRADVN